MDRNVGAKNVQLLRSLLQKRYEEEIAKLRDNFTYNFSKEKPYFELVLRVDERDFTFKVMAQELSEKQHEINTLREALKLAEKNPIVETIHEFGSDVVAHQKRGDFHRLVICCRPLPQKASEWQPREQMIHFEAFCGQWDSVEKIPF